MNPDNITHLQMVKLEIVRLAEFYKESLTPNQIKMYSEDLEDLSAEKLRESIVRYRRDPKNQKFPLPTMLRSMLSPSSNIRSIGTEIAQKIYKAISRHGSEWAIGYISTDGPNYFIGYRGDEKRIFTNWRDAVIWEIGDLGFEVIRLIGWKQLCEDETDKGIMIAQMRDLTERLYEKASHNQLHIPPSLPIIAKRSGVEKNYLEEKSGESIPTRASILVPDVFRKIEMGKK